MLLLLSLENFVTIEKLQLNLGPGLTVFTGQTGAGKSILLDGLSLCLGDRADLSMIRTGCDKAIISAAFNIQERTYIHKALSEHGIPTDGNELIVRRILVKDGNSRCFLNDFPVSVSLLKSITPHLMEIHQQFDRLLDAASHRDILDEYSQHTPLIHTTNIAFLAWKKTYSALNTLKESIAETLKTKDLLELQVQELNTFGPKENEESELLEIRQQLKQKDSLVKTYTLVSHALNNTHRSELLNALRSISKLEDETSIKISSELDQILSSMAETASQADDFLRQVLGADESIESVEDRLFELRRLARKYDSLPNELVACLEISKQKLSELEDSETGIDELTQRLEGQKSAFHTAAKKLSESRKRYAIQLDKTIHEELVPLKLGQAKFTTCFQEAPETLWAARGIDKVEFTVDMNNQGEFNPLQKVASGGEMSRLMLALKVSLARSTDLNPGLVFDEVDSGVGGDVADAVGQRLQRLAEHLQVLVITHSPQVASAGHQHCLIQKDTPKSGTVQTKASILTQTQRIDEIARMLSGKELTPQSKAAARVLLKIKQT